MEHRYALLLSTLLALPAAKAQTYCEPTFPLGCFNWHSQTITLGDIDWTSSDCLEADHTGLSTIVSAGETLPMTVASGVWTGCAVWADFDQSDSFEESENLYYIYVGADPSYTYSFDITIPPGTPAGSYRLRVISPWGSDGFLSTNTNGYGPCGTYQYGSFDDFTLVIPGTDAIAEEDAARLAVGPNPTNGPLSITSDANDPVERIAIWSADGRVVQRYTPSAPNATVRLDLSLLPAGVYQAQCYLASGTRTVQVVKD
jgi:hypothetical protein